MAEKVPKTVYLFSMLSGHNFYIAEKVSPNKYIEENRVDENIMISARHAIEEIAVDIRFIHSNKTSAEFWRKYISFPPDFDLSVWPIDVVFTKNTPYSEKGNIGLVFKKRSLSFNSTLKQLVYVDDDYHNNLDWHNNDIKIVARNLLLVLDELYKKGYLYVAFDMNRMYLNKDQSLFFEFSPSTVSLKSNATDKEYQLLFDDVSIDFMPPWIDFDNMKYVSLKVEYYAVTALLFKLFIGIMPYQGPQYSGNSGLMYALADDDPVAHIGSMRRYLQNNTFIFDEKDKSNRIGTFENDEKYIQRWDQLDGVLKSMFLDTFTHTNKNGESRKLYSIEEWISAIDKALFRR